MTSITSQRQGKMPGSTIAAIFAVVAVLVIAIGYFAYESTQRKTVVAHGVEWRITGLKISYGKARLVISHAGKEQVVSVPGALVERLLKKADESDLKLSCDQRRDNKPVLCGYGN